MSEIMEDIAYLSQEIGPRPAGTEEEQQAALYISDTLKNRTGFETSIEEFACNSKPELVKVVLCILAIIISIAAMIVDFAVIPAILIGILCAVLYVPEAIGHPLLSRALSRGVSQNVVSKYQPAARSSRRSRKVVLVASYDSGKIQKELGAAGVLPALDMATLVGMVAIPILWVSRAAFGMEAAGPALIAWNAVTIIALVLSVFPVIFFVMHQVAQYNEAANCNAASVAAMIEVAKRVANTPAVAAKPDDRVRIHGEDAARAEGLVPEGASIEYAAAPAQTDIREASAADSSAAVEKASADVPMQAGKTESFVYLNDHAGWPQEYSYEKPADKEPEAESQVQDDSVPEWYRAAQAKAHRPADTGAPVRRSRFASALDAAVETSHQRAQEAAAAQQAAREAALANAFEAARAASQPEGPIATVQADEPSPSDERREVEYEEVFPETEPAIEAESQVIDTDGSELSAEPVPVQPAPRMNSLAALAQQAVEDAIANGEDPSTFVPEPMAKPQPAKEEVLPLEEDQPVSSEQDELSVSQSESESVQEAPAQPEPVSAEESQQDPDVDAVPDGEAGEPAGGTVAIPRIDVSELRRDAARARASQPAKTQPDESASSAPAIDLPVIEVQPETERVNRNPLLDSPEMLADLPQIDTTLPQPAPLAGAGANPSLSSRIPRVNLDAFGISTKGNAEPLDNKRAALRNMVPSLSGSISFEPSAEDTGNNTVSRTGSFSPVSMSGSIGPVGDELIEGVDPEDIYVDDADDSDYAENTTASGAYAGPDYIEMPESRMSRFFDKFRRKKDKEAKEEESDNRRRVSRKGDDGDEPAWDDDWNGGAFSKMREAAAGLGRKKDKEEDAGQTEYSDIETNAYESDGIQPAVDAVDDFDQVRTDEAPQVEEESDGLIEESAPQESAAPAGNSLAAFVSELGLEEQSAADAAVEEEVKQIEDFHLKNVDVEVWFVALGSECAANGGSRAFFEEHAEELKGALIVNLEGLGAGALCQVSPEGHFGAKVASPRLKRLVKKAQRVSGVTFTDAAIRWKDSIASLALKKGLHAVTLAGIEKKKPAYLGQGDDVIENVDEETLYRRIEFVEALVRNA
ncbi:MAG: hypothetical protein ACI4B9_07040 [Eggerthellaceae bacterium]